MTSVNEHSRHTARVLVETLKRRGWRMTTQGTGPRANCVVIRGGVGSKEGKQKIAAICREAWKYGGITLQEPVAGWLVVSLWDRTDTPEEADNIPEDSIDANPFHRIAGSDDSYDLDAASTVED